MVHRILHPWQLSPKKYRWKMSKDVFLHLFVFMIRVPNIHAPKFLGNLRWEYWSFWEYIVFVLYCSVTTMHCSDWKCEGDPREYPIVSINPKCQTPENEVEFFCVLTCVNLRVSRLATLPCKIFMCPHGVVLPASGNPMRWQDFSPARTKVAREVHCSYWRCVLGKWGPAHAAPSRLALARFSCQ